MPSLPNQTAQRIGEVNWSQLDDFSLEELFLLQVPMLRTCPRFLRNRLRECFGLALRERFRGKVVADVEAEVRAWKLFGLIPMMLLHKPKGVGSVSRNELAQRIKIHQACAVPGVRFFAAGVNRRGRAGTSREGSVDESPEGTSVQGPSRVDRGISGATQCSHIGGTSSQETPGTTSGYSRRGHQFCSR